jgi:DNA primase
MNGARAMKSFSREQNQKYFEKYLGPLKPNCKGEAKMRCPFHKDQNPSMGVNLDKGVWHCFVCQLGGGPIQFEMRIGQCDRAEARRRLRAFSGSTPPFYNTSRDNIVAAYDYTDENGIVLKQVVRREGKKFSQRRPDRNGGWINCVTGVRNVPYQLAEVLRATEVFVVEGEKDVESLRQLGLVARYNQASVERHLTRKLLEL